LIIAMAMAGLAAGVWTYAARSEPASAKFAPADGNVYIGVSTDIGRLDVFDRTAGIGAHPAVYDQWTTPDGGVEPTLANARSKAGMTPMISWNLSLTGGVVTNGSKDSYIRAQADAIRSYGKPVFVRLDWEMNANADWYPDWNEPGVTPAQFIASWQHVYRLFQQEGVTNAAFVWCPTLWNGPAGLSPSAWYPGDAYVDWIGVDAYPQSAVESFILTGPGGLDDQEAFAAQHAKPMMVAEWAPALPQPDTAAAVDLLFDFAAKYPKTVKALVYFDFDTDGKDYTLVDHPVGAAEFRKRVDGKAQFLMTVR
jgi:hypothetical protein